MTDLYFRNPHGYIRELQEADCRLFSWDMGALERGRIDPVIFLNMYLGRSRPWKFLVVAVEGCAEYDQTSTKYGEPVAVYPTWQIRQGWDRLEDYCANPVSLDLADDMDIERRFRPVAGQPHKVVIYDSPNLSSYEGIRQLRMLRAIHSRYSHVEFIIHNTGSYRVIFEAGFEGALVDPSHVAKTGGVVLPSGSHRGSDKWADNLQWFQMLGYDHRELREDRSARIHYNIDSLRWANANYRRNAAFRVQATKGIDPSTPGGEYEMQVELESAVLSHNKARGAIPLPSDGVVCDSCSIAPKCKFYREGLVCSVPGTPSADLAKMFGSRDAGVIIDGLLELNKLQAVRVQKDLEDEAATGDRLPITDKRIKDLFNSGTQVAKLIDPTLNGKGTTVNVGVGITGASPIEQRVTPQELIASAVRELEANGVSREEITPKMIGGLLEGIQNRESMTRVIEGELA